VQSVGAYERGTRRAPHRETFALIAKALDVSGERYEDLAAAADIGRLRGVAERPRAPRHNLPLQLTPLIGRDEVVRQVRELVNATRLVTLGRPWERCNNASQRRIFCSYSTTASI
jgi:hypothetical protein